MEQKAHHPSKVILFGAIAGFVVAGAMFFLLRPTEMISRNDIPNPFAQEKSALKGSITMIGVKGDIPVFDIALGAGGESEGLQSDAIQFILTDDAGGIRDGAPLSAALTEGKRIFGYKYTSKDAAMERAARDLANADGAFHSFAELFPGQFFASDAQKADGTIIADFEGATGVSFADLKDVTLERNARYVIISNDGDVFVHVSNLAVCGDGHVDMDAGETCDDGNTENDDGCVDFCQVEDGYTCTGEPTECHRIIVDDSPNGDGNTDGTGDDGSGNTDGTDHGTDGNENTEGTDGTDGTTDGTDGTDGDDNGGGTDGNNGDDGDEGGHDDGIDNFTATCGNKVVENGEQCDDGNDVNDDSCDNECVFVAAPF